MLQAINTLIRLPVISVLLCLVWLSGNANVSASTQTNGPKLLYIRDDSRRYVLPDKPPALIQYDPITREQIEYDLELPTIQRFNQWVWSAWDKTTLIGHSTSYEGNFPSRFIVVDIPSGTTRCAMDVYRLNPYLPQWMGDRILFLGRVFRQNGLYTLTPATCKIELLNKLPDGVISLPVFSEFSPDHSRMVFIQRNLHTNRVYLLNLATDKVTQIVNLNPPDTVFAFWSPSSKHVVVVHEKAGYLYQVDGGVLTPLDEPKLPPHTSVGWSMDGNSLIYGNRAAKVLITISTGKRQILDRSDEYARFIHDKFSTKEYFFLGDTSPTIWRFENGQLGELIFEQQTSNANWSPDRQTLAYWDIKTKTPTLFSPDSLESHTFAALTDYHTYQWSPDSRYLIMRKFKDDMPCYLYDRQTNELNEIDPRCANGWQPTWSRDGRFVSYDRVTDNSSERNFLGVYDIEKHQKMDIVSSGGSWRDGRNFLWSPDSRFVLGDPSSDSTCPVLLDTTTGETWTPLCGDQHSDRYKHLWIP